MTDKKQKPARGKKSKLGPFFTFFLVAALVAVSSLFWIPWIFDSYTDGYSIHQTAREALVRSILWEPPELVTGTINEIPETYEPSFSADGLTMVFTRGKARHNADLHATRWNGSDWDEPEALAILNTDGDELGPALSRDGRYLYFYSNQEGGYGGYDLWVSRWDGEAWTPALNLGEEINSQFNEYGPGLSADGGRLFFSSNRLKRAMTEEEKRAWHATLRENFLHEDYDIFSAALSPPEAGAVSAEHLPSGAGAVSAELLPPVPRFGPAQRVAILNSPAHDGQVSMTPRGDFIYFSSNRDGGLGRFDLYRSRIFEGEMLEPENMGAPVNSALDDMDPALILEGHGLVFSSNRMGPGAENSFQIYRTVSREVLVQKDLSGLAALLRLLDKIKWPLLFLLLGLLALLYLLRYLMNPDFRMHSSLLQKCLLASILLHLLLVLLTSSWVVTSALYDMDSDGPWEMNVSMEALAGERLGLEIREQVTELDSLQQDEPLDLQADTLALDNPEKKLPDPERIDFQQQDPLREPAFLMPLPRAVVRESDTALDTPFHTTALAHLDMEGKGFLLEVPERQTPAQSARFAELNHWEAEQQRIQHAGDPTSRSMLPAQPAPEEPAMKPASSITRALAGALPERQEEALPDPVLKDKLEIREAALEAEIVMEVPIAERETGSKSPGEIARPRESARVDQHLESQEMQSPRMAPSPLQGMETSRVQERSPLANAHANEEAATRNPQSLPAVTARLQPHDLALNSKRRMEAPRERKSARAKELPPIELPGLVVKQEPVPLENRKIDTQPETTTFNPPAQRTRTSALTAQVPRKAASRESDLPPHEWVDMALPPREEVALSTKAMESLSPQTRQQGEPTKEIALAESKPAPMPLPLEMKRKEPKLEPLPPLEEKRVHQSLMEKPDRKAEDEAALAMARYAHDAPRTYHGLEMNNRKVVFCLDSSGSMDWNNRFVDARQELLRLLDTLDEEVEFNIITFSGDVRVWNRRGVQPGTRKNIQSAKRFVNKSRIGSSGTNTVSALSAALADNEVESIYFLSDGEPTVGHTVDPDEILELVLNQKRDRNITIHTIAYVKGDPPPQWRNRTKPKRDLIRLMRRLAEQNNGNYVVFE